MRLYSFNELNAKMCLFSKKCLLKVHFVINTHQSFDLNEGHYLE